MPDDVTTVLARVAAGLPGGGEERAGQQRMAQAVEQAIAEGRHLVVQAGTGTGKSLAYLVPAVLSGRRTVVATATKALQDQLAGQDLPALAAALGPSFSFAVLKGRSNYVCMQRVNEIAGGGEQLVLSGDRADPAGTRDGLAPDPGDAVSSGDTGRSASGEATDDPVRLGDQLRALVRWAGSTGSGDRAELEFEPSGRAWGAVSTTARECPGAFRCPAGHDCFAEAARARAAEADVVVVNTHLYGAHLASGGAVLPPHEVVVFDEAHAVEDVMTDCLGADVGPGRFRAIAATARPLLDTDAPGAIDAADALADTGDALERALRPLAGQRIPEHALTTRPQGDDAAPSVADELATVVALASGRVNRITEELRRAQREAADEPGSTRSRLDRAVLAAGHLGSDLARVAALTEDEVAWVAEGRAPSLRIAPIDVAPLLSERLWGEVSGVLTSATVPLRLPERLGLPAHDCELLDVGSPFDFRAHAMLYVARSLPDRRRPESEPALHDELERLIEAAGGRTLALFTSWRAMRAASDALRDRLDVPVLTQSDLPKPALVEAFRTSEPTCLFATLGFWQGVDLPGRTLSLVTIDRIPFPRPDDPVLQARRDRAGPGAFATVDLPRAGTLLAQGVGRLIRTSEDRGVVAVLDRRLATASYRRELLARVPPMQRCVDRANAEAFLREVTSGV